MDCEFIIEALAIYAVAVWVGKMLGKRLLR